MEEVKNTAQIGDATIRYRVFGEGKPLLLINGKGENVDTWGEGLLRRLFERFQVITFNHR
jgi:pimeloyl-ACP methyl ester carboxylesterase